MKEDMKEDVPLTAALEEIKENRPLSKAFKFSNHRKVSVSTVWLEVVFKFSVLWELLDFHVFHFIFLELCLLEEKVRE